MTKNELTELIKNDNFYPIPRYETLYLMNKLGRILSIRNRKLIKPIKYGKYSLLYSLYKNKKVERHTIYQWYTITFGTIYYKNQKVNLNGGTICQI